jgi:spore germination protein GerM
MLRRVLPSVVLAALLSACGISTDGAPRELAATTSTSTTPPEQAGTAPAVLYYVQADRLVPITRALPARNAEAIIESLLQPPAPEEGAGLSSSIPANTQMLGLERSGSLLAVDLSREFDDVVGPSRQLAIGQMVLSETALSDTTQLTFSIEGEPFKVTTSRGDVNVVSACDYASMLADPEAEEAELTTGQITLLQLRRKELKDECP